MKSKRGRNRDLTKGSIWRTLFVIAAPIVFGFALQTGFNLIDTFFIGMLGAEQLAAISVTFPVVFIFIAIASGLAIGSTVLVSQAIGAKSNELANNTAIHAMLIGMIAGTMIAILGLIFSPPLFEFMGVHGDTLQMTIQYANLIFLGFVFLFIGFVAQGIIQAGGDTVTPTRNLATAIIINIILDPIFIFGLGFIPAMGLVGAGMATVLARSVGAFLNIFHIFSGRTTVCVERRCFVPDPKIFRRIITTGLPTSVSNSINSIGLILLTSLVGGFGTMAIAAFGVGIRLESLAILPIIGLSSGMIPIIGQNLGSGKMERAKKTASLASYAAILFMLFFSAVWVLFPEALYSVFTSDPEVIGIGAEYFRVIAYGYVFLGLNFVIGAAFQGAGRTTLQLIITLTRWVLVVVIAWFLVSGMGLQGIWIGFPVGNFLAFLVAFVLLKSGFWLRKWAVSPLPNK